MLAIRYTLVSSPRSTVRRFTHGRNKMYLQSPWQGQQVYGLLSIFL